MVAPLAVLLVALADYVQLSRVDSAAGIGSHCTLIFSMVTDDEAVKQVLKFSVSPCVI